MNAPSTSGRPKNKLSPQSLKRVGLFSRADQVKKLHTIYKVVKVWEGANLWVRHWVSGWGNENKIWIRTLWSRSPIFLTRFLNEWINSGKPGHSAWPVSSCAKFQLIWTKSGHSLWPVSSCAQFQLIWTKSGQNL